MPKMSRMRVIVLPFVFDGKVDIFELELLFESVLITTEVRVNNTRRSHLSLRLELIQAFANSCKDCHITQSRQQQPSA